MKAIVVAEHGSPESLLFKEVPDPRPKANEVLVEVRACAMNHLDLWVRRGVPGHTFPLPLIPGCDVAGIVVEVGSVVTNVKPGDRVAVSPGLSCGLCRACLSGLDHHCPRYGIFGETRDGGCAERIVAPAANMIPIPASLDFVPAASISLVFLTSWNMLVRRAGVRPGQTVLVHAAGSGVGSAAIQIAKLWGARVIATAGSDEKIAKARELGADHGVNYKTGDFVDEVKRLTDRRGVDIVVEHVGAATWAGSLRCLGWRGIVVTCGATTGPKVDLNLQHVFFKGLSILGSTMGSKGDLLEVWDHVAAGRFRPVIDCTFPLADAASAHAYIENREQFGKVVLVS